MKFENAETTARAYSARLSAGETLSDAERQEYDAAKAYIMDVSEQAMAFSRSQNADNAEDRIDAALGTKKKFWTPGRVISAQIIAGLAIASISVIGGMRFERSRKGKSIGSNLTSLGLTNDTPLSDSPQSHPATSPLDGRLANHRGNPGNEGNTTNHPGPRAGRSAPANT